jgi:hypothetical protein
MARLEIEHIIPIAKGGSNDESNLWLACPICNRYKSDKITNIDSETGEINPVQVETYSFFYSKTQVFKMDRV